MKEEQISKPQDSAVHEELSCTCKGLKKAVNKGVADMITSDPPASSSVIVDYMHDMVYGGWVNCHCAASDEKQK